MIDESWYVRPQSGIRERISAGGVICRVENDQILAALTTERGLDAYILPKGGVKKKETLEQAAVREIEEEAGLTDLHLLASLGTRERLDYLKTKWITTHYFLYATEQIRGIPTDPNHAYEVRWFPLDHLPEMFWPEQRTLIEANRDLIESEIRAAV
ncbi:MAG: NUDIX domain-containing protein [Armatimonadota bacterium]